MQGSNTMPGSKNVKLTLVWALWMTLLVVLWCKYDTEPGLLFFQGDDRISTILASRCDCDLTTYLRDFRRPGRRGLLVLPYVERAPMPSWGIDTPPQRDAPASGSKGMLIGVSDNQLVMAQVKVTLSGLLWIKRDWALSIPLSFCAIAATVPLVGYVAWSRRLLASRRRSGRCVQCGYDLRGNTSGRCPECGGTER